MRRVSIGELRADMREILDSVEHGGKVVIVTRHGRSSCRIVPLNRSGKEYQITIGAWSFAAKSLEDLADKINHSRSAASASVDGGGLLVKSMAAGGQSSSVRRHEAAELEVRDVEG